MTKNICEIVGKKVSPFTDKKIKIRMIRENINPSRYFFKMVNGTMVNLIPRFHNVRDSIGRWTVERV